MLQASVSGVIDDLPKGACELMAFHMYKRKSVVDLLIRNFKDNKIDAFYNVVDMRGTLNDLKIVQDMTAFAINEKPGVMIKLSQKAKETNELNLESDRSRLRKAADRVAYGGDAAAYADYQQHYDCVNDEELVESKLLECQRRAHMKFERATVSSPKIKEEVYN